MENQFLALEAQVLRAKMANVDELLAEKDEAIVERNRMISERKAIIAERNARVAARDATIAERNRMISELKAIVAERNARVAARDRVIADLRAQLAQSVAKAEDEVVIARTEVEALKQARRDLRWTLSRLGRTPVIGRLIRARAGFSRLVEKYLND
ncbi:MAG: hypothetical protein WB239_11350 [Acidimicrobiia bacterium]